MKHRTAKLAELTAAYWGKTTKVEDRDWDDIKALDDGKAEIRIYDIIGWPFVSADEFARDLNRIEADEITVAINSPGGDVFDGSAIFSLLQEHPAHIITRIDGIAASMASIIALAGDEVQVTDNAYFMIHNPWTIMWGDQHDLAKESDLLGRIASTLAENYARKTGESVEDMQTLMDDETWYIGNEIVENGFADTINGHAEENARYNLSMFDNVPNALRSQPRQFADGELAPKDFERVLRDSGFTRSQATAIAARGYSGINQSDSDVLDEINQLTETFKRSI